jgi:amino acid transporter
MKLRWFYITMMFGFICGAIAFFPSIFPSNSITLSDGRQYVTTCTGTAFNWPAFFLFISAALFIMSILGMSFNGKDEKDDEKEATSIETKEDRLEVV